jgi:hypothetical protein
MFKGHSIAEVLQGVAGWVFLLGLVLWVGCALLSRLTAWAARGRIISNRFDDFVDRYLLNILCGAFAAHFMFGWFAPSQPSGPSAGDRCGPHHHWRNVAIAGDDLSCEEDREGDRWTK